MHAGPCAQALANNVEEMRRRHASRTKEKQRPPPSLPPYCHTVGSSTPLALSMRRSELGGHIITKRKEGGTESTL